MSACAMTISSNFVVGVTNALAFSLIMLLVLTNTPSVMSISLADSCATVSPVDGIPAGWTQRSFTLFISESSASASAVSTNGSSLDDGYRLVVNGTSPGPRLDMNEFDWITINVTSLLPYDTITAIHWHGLTLYATPYNDGVAGVTQCGIGGGESVLYSFCAYPSGDYWYHGLNNFQTINGLYGALIIEPQTNYTASPNATSDTIIIPPDLILMAADVFEAGTMLNSSAVAETTIPPAPIGVVVNGAPTLTYHAYANSSSGTLIVRMINAGSLSSFVFSIDGVALNVIALDGSSVAPYAVSSVQLAVGQRVTASVDFSALSNTASVFVRVNQIPTGAQTSSASVNSTQSNTQWLGVIHINSALGNDTSLPTYYGSNSTAAPPAPVNASFSDVNSLAARPTNYESIGSSYYGSDVSTVSIPTATHSLTLHVLNTLINNVTYDTAPIDSLYLSQVDTPPLYNQFVDVNTASLPANQTSIITSAANNQYVIPIEAVVDVMILNSDAIQHSFHLHGHHFWIISTSDYPAAEFIYYNAYIVRDTVAVPAYGWAQIRFVAINPGAWLLSESSDWYFSEGLAIVFLESTQSLTPLFAGIPGSQLELCNSSIQAEISDTLATWHSANDPVTYASTGLSETARIIIGAVVGGGSGLVLLIIILCTVFGIRDEAKKEENQRAMIAEQRRQSLAGNPNNMPASTTVSPMQQSVTLPNAPGVYA